MVASEIKGLKCIYFIIVLHGCSLTLPVQYVKKELTHKRFSISHRQQFLHSHAMLNMHLLQGTAVSEAGFISYFH